MTVKDLLAKCGLSLKGCYSARDVGEIVIPDFLLSLDVNVKLIDADTIRKWWRFDNNQQPLSSWHDREDFISKVINDKSWMGGDVKG